MTESSRSSKNDSSDLQEMTLELRSFLLTLVKTRLKRSADKKKLAAALGLKESAVNALLYRGVGSFETISGAALFVLGMDSRSLKRLLTGATEDRSPLLWSAREKTSPVRESDRIWHELDEVLDENEKVYWASLIRAATEIDLSLKKKPSSKRNAK